MCEPEHPNMGNPGLPVHMQEKRDDPSCFDISRDILARLTQVKSGHPYLSQVILIYPELSYARISQNNMV